MNSQAGFLMTDGYYASYNTKLAVLGGQAGRIKVLDTTEHTIHERGYEPIFCVK